MSVSGYVNFLFIITTPLFGVRFGHNPNQGAIMKKENKTYTRDQKITYYMNKCNCLNFAIKELQANLKKAQNRVLYLQSDKYQDWNEKVSEEISDKFEE